MSSDMKLESGMYLCEDFIYIAAPACAVLSGCFAR